MRLRPRRDLEVVARPDGCDVLDRYGVRLPVHLGALAAEIYGLLTAGKARAAIVRELGRRHGVRVSAAELDGLVAELRAAALFDDETAAQDRRLAWRRALVGGTLVLGARRTAGELRAVAAAALAQAGNGHAPAVLVDGMLSPHGDLAATGACAAHAYARLTRDNWPDAFVIAGTSHYGAAPSLLDVDVRTALGVVACDRALAAALAARLGLRFALDPPDFLVEHSWQQDLPLMQLRAEELDRPLRVVPILVGDLSHEAARELGRLVRRVAFGQLKRVCLVASGDLTHFGAGYAWRPPALARPRSAAAVGERIAALEAPLVDAIARRDGRRFARGVAATSFCARAQVSALLAFASCDGRLVARQTVLNWQPVTRLPRRRFGAGDRLFNGAGVLFAVDRLHAAGRALCANVLFSTEDGELRLFHRCDASTVELPAAAWPLLHELLRGWPSLDELAARLADHPSLVVGDEALAGFVAQLEARGLVHEGAPPSLGARARATIAHARREVPFYARLASDDPARAPFCDADAVRADWRALFARGALDGVERIADGERFSVRWSSASGGKPAVATVVETEVRAERRLGERLVRDDLVAERIAHVNRPSNLGVAAAGGRWPKLRDDGSELHLSPGPNPTAVAPDVWARSLAALSAFDPEILEGDPAYLAELGRHSVAAGARLPRLRLVVLGHAFPWRLWRDAVAAAWRVPVAVRYHTSELGEIGMTCARGALHLIETRTLFEILDGGAAVRPGGAGALVATTLDTRLRPLIRYVLGDVVALEAAACPCGRPFRTIRHLGRMRDLFGARRFVTYADVDEAIGSPAGVRFFRLSVAGRRARLRIVGERELIDAARLRGALEPLVSGRVAVEIVRRLPIAGEGKLAVVSGDGDAARWRRRFCGA